MHHFDAEMVVTIDSMRNDRGIIHSCKHCGREMTEFQGKMEKFCRKCETNKMHYCCPLCVKHFARKCMVIKHMNRSHISEVRDIQKPASEIFK